MSLKTSTSENNDVGIFFVVFSVFGDANVVRGEIN